MGKLAKLVGALGMVIFLIGWFQFGYLFGRYRTVGEITQRFKRYYENCFLYEIQIKGKAYVLEVKEIRDL